MKTISRFFRLLFICISIVSIASCRKEVVTSPEVETLEPTGLFYNSAVLGGNVKSDGGTTITERGVCWSINPGPTVSDVKELDTTAAEGEFTVISLSLPLNRTTYVRAFATNSKGTSYGQEVTFTLWLNNPEEQVRDFDNNAYNTVHIGGQIWMAENLRTTHYRNGDSISYLPFQFDSDWLTTTEGAYCSYEDNPDNSAKFGYLYNGYAVLDSRGLCPTGWHLPSKVEMETLVDYMGGMNTAGDRLKSISFWENLNDRTSNISGFSALPGGARVHPLPERTYTIFYGLNTYCYLWTGEEYVSTLYPNLMWYIQMMDVTEWALIDNSITKKSGLSVRCIKD